MPIKEDFIEQLLRHNPHKIASLWILERRPHIFNNEEQFIDWKFKLGNLIGVDAGAIRIVGSCCAGLSLNPTKNYKLFDENSDVDVAIISTHHFDVAWRTLRNMKKSDREKLTPKVKTSVQEHVEQYIYFGTIATDKILPLFPFGKEWASALETMKLDPVTKNRTVKARIYRDFESLRGYTATNLYKLRDAELTKGTANA